MKDHRLFLPVVILVLTWLGQPGYTQGLRINEVMSSNQKSFYDEDQDTPDWIELYNSGPDTVNLAGYGISDELSAPYKWIFPDMVLEPGKFLILAASGKDRRTPPLFWETVITANDTFRYLVPSADPGAWRNPGFPDVTWALGRSGFGYGDGDDTTVVPNGTISVLIRRSFVVKDLASVKQMMLHVDFDDAFVAYLNGHEIARAQIGTPGIPPSWNMPAANSNHEAAMYQGGLPDAFRCDSAVQYLVEGNNLFAIEVHNADASSTDLSCTPFLTLGRSKEPEPSRGTPSYLTFGNSYLHLNFKLSSAGDTALLTDPFGELMDSLHIGALPPDVSLGLKPDGVHSRWFFDKPTPGAANLSKAYPVLTYTDPVFSHPGGFQDGLIDLEILGAEPGDTIWYTTDGSVPKPGSNQYTGPIQLNTSRVIRAIISGPGRMTRKPVTRSYLFRLYKPTITTISLSTDPPNFFDWDTGIYVLGPHASPEVPNLGANFWEEWERPVHIELFETDGSLGMEADAGVKIFGNWSRANPQKSLSFHSRGFYGTSVFRYQLFPDLPYTEYNNFILRNSGNDWNNTMFRDAFMCSLLDYSNLDRMAYRPASIYLNGEYWGLLNIREKINVHFLATHHGVDPYQTDLLELWGYPISGDAEHYNNMLNFLTGNSPSQKTNYDMVKTMMNVENFMEFQIAHIFFNNTDWPGNNIKYWRPRTPEGRWRWIVFDTDFGFSVSENVVFNYTHNTLAFALATNGPDWPNPPWSTLLFRRLLESQEFKNEFINRFADRLNTSFSYQTVLQRINQMSKVIEDEIPYHLDRWNQWGEDIETWKANVQTLREFASYRVPLMRNFISQQFSNIGMANLNLITPSPQGGNIQLNTLLLTSFPWVGVYFKNVPVRITARPNPGYRFVRWEGPVAEPLSLSTTVTLTGYTTIKAVFEEDGSGLNEVIINEIYYNDPPGFDADDWIELYNHGVTTADLSGWILRDEDTIHSFSIPAGTLLYPKDYLVLCRNASKYRVAYPDNPAPVGDFSFGLGSTGDCIKLLTADSVLADSVCYGVIYPWPSEPNNNGTSLELINPDYDNSMAVNWMASASPHGTPGMANSLIAGIEDANLERPDNALECFPNPFSVYTNIRYEVPTKERIRLSVFDMHGHLVNTLFEGEAGPGMKEMIWDGYGSDGSLLGPGIYICALETRYTVTHCRVVIIR